jgi:ornithine decarboxylase
MSPPSPASGVFHAPAFEGSEKRVSVAFAPAPGAEPAACPAGGLRALPRAELDALMALAGCEIISRRSGLHFDAYILSESSLFVYPDRAVLKTCGTTRLLDCLPRLVASAAALGLAPARVKYSRASFLFPDRQPAPHRSFADERAALEALFAGLGPSSAYVLGDAHAELQWHVYVAGAAAPRGRPVAAVEIAMTGLCPERAAQFARGPGFVSARATTAATGIAALVPGHDVDDYVFEPCGYSMNGLAADGPAHSTVHITPEPECSYASFELSGHCPDRAGASELAARAAAVFRPRRLAVALSADGAPPGGAAPGWGAPFAPPAGYACASASYQELRCGGYVAFFTLDRLPEAAAAAAAAAAALAAAAAKRAALASAAKAPPPRGASGGSSGAGSPRAALKQFPSFRSLAPPSAPGGAADDVAMLGGGGSSDNSSEGTDAQAPASLLAQLGALPAALAVEEVLALHGAAPLADGGPAAVDALAAALVAAHGLEDNFYVLDLGAVQRLWRAWGEALPRVRPHYAVKCNSDPALLATLAALGAGFDCASEAEVEAVLALGVAPERVVFANPCKRPSDVRAAARRGVALSTFDTVAELAKLARWQPGARVLLRIRADDPTARCPLGNKFGAEEREWPALFEAAAAAGVPVEGVSFHVGSGATNPAAFGAAVEAAARAFALGAAYGFDMGLLDIGGGFSGGGAAGAPPPSGADGPGDAVHLAAVAPALNAALDAHFPPSSGVRVIAEPGRFFAEAVATYYCLVFGKRERVDAADVAGPRARVDYWVTDGLYGSMNCLLYDHATLAPRPLLRAPGAPPRGEPAASTVFGPTCDGLDTVVRDYPLPPLEVGDWLAFPAMGAYTLCGASRFNGMNVVDVPTFYAASARP